MKMKFAFLLLPLLFQITNIHCQEKTLFNSIKSHDDGVGLWWAGHNGWIIKSDDLVITTDILLNYDKRKIPTSITPEELAEVIDISFITHGHKDHFNRSTTNILVEHSNCIFVIPQSCLHIAKELNIPEDRIKIAEPRNPFEILGIKVEPIRAIHGNANFAIYYDANLQDCGYVLNIGGKRFLQPGDSYLLEDHLFLKDIDVLFFSPTEHNMYIDRSVILINKLDPKYIFPQHRNTIVINNETRFWAKSYHDEVKLRLSTQLQKKFYIQQQGKKIIIE